MTPDTLRSISDCLTRIREEYTELAAVSSARFSIQELLDDSQLRIAHYCRELSLNLHGAASQKLVKKFGQRYGIWPEYAGHYISCSDYLYPSASLERLVLIAKNQAVGFYLNDTMGREKVGLLTSEQRQLAGQIRSRMATIGEDLRLCSAAHPVEQANVEVLAEIKKLSSTEWFTEFLRLYSYQIDITHINRNASALGHIPSIDEYIDARCHLSGTYYVIHLVEFADNQFLSWPELIASGLAQPLRRLHWLIAAVNGLLNDFVSFEKEFIDCGSDSNLITIIVLNEPSLSLYEAIIRAGAMIGGLIDEFLALIQELKSQSQELLTTDPELANTLELHLHGLERCTQGSWAWHLQTMRYKRAASIWRETRLDSRG